MALLRSRTHLAGGLARVGEHQLLGRPDSFSDKREEPLHDDARLAAPRPGEDQAGALAMRDGGALVGVEVGPHHRILGLAGERMYAVTRKRTPARATTADR